MIFGLQGYKTKETQWQQGFKPVTEIKNLGYAIVTALQKTALQKQRKPVTSNSSRKFQENIHAAKENCIQANAGKHAC